MPGVDEIFNENGTGTVRVAERRERASAALASLPRAAPSRVRTRQRDSSDALSRVNSLDRLTRFLAGPAQISQHPAKIMLGVSSGGDEA